MTKLANLLVAGVLSALCSTSALARDTVESYSVDEALALPKAKEILGSEVKFYFGESKYGRVATDYGVFKTNKKTNAFNKSDKEACQWVFLSAMKALKDRAQRSGGNAVVEIKSNYKGNLTVANDTFRCGAGTFVAGVALTGKVVKLK